MKTIQADGKTYRLAYRPVEMGCIARVTGHKQKCNEGRIVQVLIPLQPGERYGHARRRAPTPVRPEQLWQIAALDGSMLEYAQGGKKKHDITVAVRQSMLRRLKEVTNDQAT